MYSSCSSHDFLPFNLFDLGVYELYVRIYHHRTGEHSDSLKQQLNSSKLDPQFKISGFTPVSSYHLTTPTLFVSVFIIGLNCLL